MYFPERFLPPEFSALARSLNPDIIQALTYAGADGREIVRPPGLSDMPGGAAVAGMMTMVLGLSLGLGRDRGWVVRASCMAAAAIGMTASYLTQVRSLTLVAAASVAVFAVLRFRQGRTMEGTLTLGVGAALVVGSYIWALPAVTRCQIGSRAWPTMVSSAFFRISAGRSSGTPCRNFCISFRWAPVWVDGE